MRVRWRFDAPPLPELGLVAAALVAVARMTGIGASLTGVLSQVLPIDTATIDPLDALTAVLALAALAVGVRRRKRLAWPMAMAMFVGSVAAQILVLHHPVGAALALACLVLLIADVGGYRTRSGHRMRFLAGVVMVAGVLVLILGSILVDLAAAASVGSPLDTIARWVTDAIGFVDSSGAIGSGGALLDTLEFVVQAAVLVAALAILTADPDRPRPAELEQRRVIARRHVRGGLAPFQMGPDKLLFADREGSAVVAYGLAGRSAVVVGDPIGPLAEANAAFQSFETYCSRGDVDVSVYQASADMAALLTSGGYRVFRVGSEALIDLRTFGLAGPRRANLRHTVARARRGGVALRWYPDGMPAADVARWSSQLRDVDRDWQARRGRAMRFTVGAFEVSDLANLGIAMALAGEDHVEAFVTFRRTAPQFWVLDLTRRRESAHPGALEACIAEAAIAMQIAGDRELSLGLVALMGITLAEGPLEERVLAVARSMVAARYNIDGLRFFKEKFDPQWATRYGAVRGRLGFAGFALAILRLHLGIGTNVPSGSGGSASSAGSVLTSLQPVVGTADGPA